MLLLLVPILPFPTGLVKETPALILRFAPLHLECCLCRNSLPPSPSILQTSRDMLVPYFPPILHFFSSSNLPLCTWSAAPSLSSSLHPSPCPALYLVRPVGPLGPADGSPSLLLPSLRPPYARKILLYSPAPRPVCVAIPSGSHCDASSAPRPVLIPRARAEMLGPLCVRSAQVSIGPVPSAGPPCGWLRRRLTLECPLAVPAMGLISSAPVCVSPGSVPYRKVPAKSGACEICATEFRAPTTRSIMFHALRSPRTVNAPDEAKGSTLPLERV
jgi:hypothetical protein